MLGQMKSRMTIVVKVGSASLVDQHTLRPIQSAFDSIADTICLLRAEGNNVILVSSGSVAIGRGIWTSSTGRISEGPRTAMAAVGQTKLMSLWSAAFARTGQTVAQILISKETELSKPCEQTSSMLCSLLNAGVVPIVNENDAVAASEFGGNDVVAVIVAKMVDASILAFLTDVDCLYTRNPGIHADAKAIEVVEDFTRLELDVSSQATSLGTGGMDSKLMAAKVASSFGIATIINNIETVHNVLNVVHNLTYRSDRTNRPCSLGWKLDSADSLPTSLHTVFLPCASS